MVKDNKLSFQGQYIYEALTLVKNHGLSLY